MDVNSLQPGTPERSSLFDAARRARASICRGAPRPDTIRKPRRAERGNGAARQRGGSAATRRPARFCGWDEHGEHPPVAPFEHRGTCPVSSRRRRSPHDAASSRARPAADDHDAQPVLVSDMARRSQRPRLAQCADVRWETPVSRALTWGVSPSSGRFQPHRVISAGVQRRPDLSPSVSVLVVPNQNNLTSGRRTWQPHHNPAFGGQGSGGRNHSYVRRSKP
jgi:hypothetical protein